MVHIFDNLFPQKDITILKRKVAETEHKEVDEALGRLLVDWVPVPEDIRILLLNTVNQHFNTNFSTYYEVLFAQYSIEYGTPNLPPHFDGDDTELILDYQLESNTDWPIGLDTSLYTLKDNQALAFNPNERAHWRMRKTFKDGEYVNMLFFRFYTDNDRKDYSHKRLDQSDSTLKRVEDFRNSLS